MLNCYWVAIIYHLFDDNCWWRQCFTDPTYQIDLLMGASGRHRGGIFQSKQNVSMSLHDMYPVCCVLQDIPALTIFWGCFLLTSFCIFIGKHPAYPHSNWSVFEVLFRVYYTLKVNFTENIEISGWWENPTGLNFNYSSYIYLNQCLIRRPTIDFHNIQYNNMQFTFTHLLLTDEHWNTRLKLVKVLLILYIWKHHLITFLFSVTGG